jgi:hypothetical protein
MIEIDVEVLRSSGTLVQQVATEVADDATAERGAVVGAGAFGLMNAFVTTSVNVVVTRSLDLLEATARVLDTAGAAALAAADDFEDCEQDLCTLIAEMRAEMDAS